MTSTAKILEAAFLRVLHVSWQAALLILLVVAVQWLLRGKISAGWRHALWGLVLLRLVLLWTLPAPFSVYNIVHTRSAFDRKPVIYSVSNAAQEIPAPVPNVPESQTITNTPYSQAPFAVPGKSVPLSNLKSEIPPANAPQKLSIALAPLTLAALAWLTGATLAIAIMVLQGRRLARRVAKERLVVQPDVLELLEECKQRMGVNTWLPVISTACVEGPALLGVIRPRLLLPRELVESAPRDHLRYVFLHEIAHLKRGDILFGWLVNVLLALHWFNPLLWWARNRIAADRELACDALVLSELDSNERTAYGHALLDQFHKFRPPAWSPGLAGVLEGKTNMERRIAMVTRFKESPRWAKGLALATILVLGIVVLTDAQEARADLSIRSSDIFAFVAENGGTMIAGTITNTGPKDLPVDIAFYEGDPNAGGKRINTGGLIVPANGQATEAISWPVKPGAYTVYAVVDPNNTIAEADETNNEALRPITCEKGPRFAYTDSSAQSGVASQLNLLSKQQMQNREGAAGPSQTAKADDNTRILDDLSAEQRLKQLGIVFKLYANRHNGYMPALSPKPGALTVDVDDNQGGEPFKSFLGDQADALMHELSRCIYLGYAVTSDDEVECFAAAYTKQLATAGAKFDADLSVPTDKLARGKILRLREGIERFYITDINNPAASSEAQSKMPVLIEFPRDQADLNSCYILFMDGHVQNIPYPGKFPMTEVSIKALRELAAIAPTKPANAEKADQNLAPVAATPQSNSAKGRDATQDELVALSAKLSNEPSRDDDANIDQRLKQLGLVFKWFANEHKGLFPVLSPNPGALTVDVENNLGGEPFGSYLFDDADALMNELDRCIYLGYAVTSDNDMASFAAAYEKELKTTGQKFEADLPDTTGNPDRHEIKRLREGIERFYITDINNPDPLGATRSKIPVLIHIPSDRDNIKSTYVLFMDGHVENMPFPGKFPMTPAMKAILTELTKNSTPAAPGLNATSEETLKALGLAFKYFANGNKREFYPVLSPKPHVLEPDLQNSIDGKPFSAYLSKDVLGNVWTGKEQALIEEGRFLYLGFVVRSDEEVAEFAQAYERRLQENGGFESDLNDPTDKTSAHTLHRFREGIEHFLITDISKPVAADEAARIPLVIEWPDLYQPNGGNVLFLDGHVEYIAYPGKFPLTEATITTLRKIAPKPTEESVSTIKPIANSLVEKR